MTLLQRDRENLELGREEGTRYAIKIIRLHSQGMKDNSIASSLQLPEQINGDKMPVSQS